MLLTGFHAAHVLAGIILLAVVGAIARPRAVETGAAFWHMVDLVWVLLFPVVYLL
jgi:nitric oxide reductase NorE protein